MEKLPMCRICLVQNVRMYLVVNRNFHELYEKLTDIPFVTEDRRPILACFFCFAKLKQCYRFLRKCLEAEELFAQMINEDYEPNPLINQDHLEYLGGFIKSPIQNINIVEVVQTESIAIKEELPAVCEGPDDVIEPKEEHQSDELEPEIFDNICLGVADIPPHNSETNFEYDYDVPLIEFKTEVEEEQEVSKKKQNACEMKKLRAVADIPPHSSKTYLEYDVPLIEFKTEVEEEPEVSKKKQNAWEMKRATVAKNPKLDTPRRSILEDALTAEQTKKEKPDLKVIHTTHPSERFKCDVCQRTFSEKNHLTQHIRIHTGEKPYKCDVCLRRFSQMGHLTLHVRRHTGEKPYKCDVCQRSFSEKGCLTKHTRIHTGEKPYKCDICQRSFSEKGCLTKHTRIHTGEKPYKCDVCQRSFSQKYILTKHICVHTGEKPYKCDVCQRSFSRKSNCTKHIRIHTAKKSYI